MFCQLAGRVGVPCRYMRPAARRLGALGRADGERVEPVVEERRGGGRLVHGDHVAGVLDSEELGVSSVRVRRPRDLR